MTAYKHQANILETVGPITHIATKGQLTQKNVIEVAQTVLKLMAMLHPIPVGRDGNVHYKHECLTGGHGQGGSCFSCPTW